MQRDRTTDRTRPARLPDHPAVAAVASLLLAGLLVLVLLVRADGDPSMLVHAGPPWADPVGAPSSLTVQEADAAFDGQFFYRLGVDPIATDETVAGITFDLPALRNARWGYGALTWLVSGGRTDLVPTALIVVNLVAAAAIGWSGAILARSAGRPPLTGLAIGLWPGFVYSLSLDTAELLASTLLLAGLLTARRRRWPAASILLVAAVLVRDTTVVVPFGFAVAGALGWIRRRRDGSGASDATASAGPEPTDEHRGVDPTGSLVAGLPPLLFFVFWQLLQVARFGELPLTSSGDNNLSVPLLGFVRLVTNTFAEPGGETLFRLACAVGLLILIGAAGVTIRRRGILTAEVIAWFAAVAVVALLNTYLWSGATAFMRAGTEAALLSIVLLIAPSAAGDRIRPVARRVSTTVPRGTAVLLVILLAGWLLTAGAQIGKIG